MLGRRGILKPWPREEWGLDPDAVEDVPGWLLEFNPKTPEKSLDCLDLSDDVDSAMMFADAGRGVADTGTMTISAFSIISATSSTSKDVSSSKGFCTGGSVDVSCTVT